MREVVEDLIGLDMGSAGQLQERRHVAEVEVADAPVPDQAGAPGHVRENARAAQVDLREDDLMELDPAFPPPSRPIPLEVL